MNIIMAKEETMTGFEVAIKAYLDKRAQEDALFRVTYAKKNKSIKECCAYIRQEAKKQAVKGCTVLSDDEVYGMAVHYYDEDSIKVKDAPKATVKTPTKTPAKPAEPIKATDLTKLSKKEVRAVKKGGDCYSLF